MSFAPEVTTDNSGKFYGNALRFATREEAEANANLFAKTQIPMTDPVNYQWVFGNLVPVV